MVGKGDYNLHLLRKGKKGNFQKIHNLAGHLKTKQQRCVPITATVKTCEFKKCTKQNTTDKSSENGRFFREM